MSVTAAKQMEINAIINDLIYADTPHFSPVDADKLKDFVLIDANIQQTSSRNRFVLCKEREQTFNGFAEGVGGVEFDQKETSRIHLIGNSHQIWCGNWALLLYPSEDLHIGIQDRFADTKASFAPKFSMAYDETGDPDCFYRADPVVKRINLIFFSLTSVHWDEVPFKKPAPRCSQLTP